VIVVDSNVIVYCWVSGARSDIAQRLRAADPGWHVPILWRSEVRNALAGFMRQDAMSLARARGILHHIESELAGFEHLPAGDAVLEILTRSQLSAYDAEFVALAEELGVVLVTEDKMVLKTFPSLAVSMERFLGHGQ